MDNTPDGAPDGAITDQTLQDLVVIAVFARRMLRIRQAKPDLYRQIWADYTLWRERVLTLGSPRHAAVIAALGYEPVRQRVQEIGDGAP